MNMNAVKYIFIGVLIACIFASGCGGGFGQLTSGADGSPEKVSDDGASDFDSGADASGEEAESDPYVDWNLSEADKLPYGKYAVMDEGWVYYASATNEGLCRMREDGSEQQQLSNDYPIYGITVAGEWIYYNATPKIDGVYVDSSLYRVRADGSEHQALFEKCSSYTLTKAEIFYTLAVNVYESSSMDAATESSKITGRIHEIWKAGFDGTNAVSLKIEGHVLNALAEWVYYSDGDSVYRYSSKSGINEQVITLQATHWPIYEYENWLYIQSYGKREHGIFKMRPNGRDASLLLESVGSIVIAGGYLYYSTKQGEISRRLLGTGEMEEALIGSKHTGLFDVVGDWIYFEDMDDPHFNNWRIRLDGTELQEL